MKHLTRSLLLALGLKAFSLPASASTCGSPISLVQATPLAGTVLAEGTKQPIAYASVGVMEESTGTISDEKGSFQLRLSPTEGEKIVRISAIGYEAREIKAKDLLAAFDNQRSVTIYLVSRPVQLAEVKVDGSKWKSKELGGTLGPNSKFAHSFIITPRPITANLGREIGIHINNGQKLSLLSKLNFCLKSNKYEFVKFRLNVYDIKNGKPNQNILPQPIYVTVKNRKTGWMQVDLEPYNLYLAHDFIISLEWIDALPKTHSLSLSLPAGMPGLQTTFHKDASQSKWQKIPAAGMGMNVVVQREM
jgi:hypothetical protein